MRDRNPWSSLPTQPPFVLSCDQPQVTEFNDRASPDHYLHLEIVPEPFLGNPEAPVVLLNLNPCFSQTDVAEHLKPQFLAAAQANLLHSYEPYPFYLLDPELPSPGRDWWLQKLRALIARVGVQAVANSIFVAEVHGYHSRKYHHRVRLLPSQRYSLDLITAALNRQALVVIMRGARHWYSLIPQLLAHSAVARLRNVRNPCISSRNCPEAFERIVAAIETAG